MTYNKQICIICGNSGSISMRTSDGPVCQCCYKKTHIESCYICGQEKSIAARVENKPICPNCWRRTNKEICSQCGNLRIVCKRLDTGKPLCESCCKKSNMGICKGCGKFKPISARKMLCGACSTYNNPKCRYQMYKSNAKKRGVAWHLNFEEFLVFWQLPCFYCGININTVGIDRLRNGEGYHLSNCVPCCAVCNHAKNNMTFEEFLVWIQRLTGRVEQIRIPSE